MSDPLDDELASAERRFDRLLRLYPRPYSRRYGGPLRDTLLDQHRALPTSARTTGRYWLRQGRDAATNALALHVAYLVAGEGAGDPAPIRSGALIGATAGFCLALGALLGELSAWPLAQLEESLANALCAVFLLLVCGVSGWWAGARPGAIRRGAVAGAATGGLAGGCTGVAYLLIDQLFLDLVARQPEKQVAFARIYLLVTTAEATVLLTLFGLLIGGIVGGGSAGYGGGARRSDARDAPGYASERGAPMLGLRTRQDPSPIPIWLRRGVLVAVLLDVALVGGLALRYRPLLAQPDATRYLLEPLILLLVYAAFGIWLGTLRSTSHRIALEVGVALGLLTGALWLVNLTTETFTDLTGRLGILATAPFLLGAFALWGVAGAVAAWRTHRVHLGLLAALTSAILCVLLTVTYGFLLPYVALPLLEQALVGNPDYLRSGWADLRAFTIANTFDAGFSHLLVAPIVAALVGGLGGTLARGWQGRRAASPRGA